MRYGIQWILFSVFCAINVWLWFAYIDDSPRTTVKIEVASPPAEKPVQVTQATIVTPAAQPLPPAEPVQTDGVMRLVTLLLDADYEQAVGYYDSLYPSLSPSEAETYRQTITTHATTLLQKSVRDDAVQLLQQYTQVYYKDIEALSLLARAYHAGQDYIAEIQALFAALNEAHLQEDIDTLRAKLNTAVVAHADALRRIEPSAVLTFYQDLIGREPQYPPFRLGLAQALIDNARSDEVVFSLEGLRGDPVYGAKAEQLLAKAEQTTHSRDTSIPLNQIGDNYSVAARINGVTDVTLLVDTGASLTTIRPEALRSAGISVNQRQRTTTFTTANGSVRGPVVRIASLALGEQVVNDLEVGSIALPGLEGIDGLLGMNFLKNFEFAIRQQDNVLHLTR